MCIIIFHYHKMFQACLVFSLLQLWNQPFLSGSLTYFMGARYLETKRPGYNISFIATGVSLHLDPLCRQSWKRVCVYVCVCVCVCVCEFSLFVCFPIIILGSCIVFSSIFKSSLHNGRSLFVHGIHCKYFSLSLSFVFDFVYTVLCHGFFIVYSQANWTFILLVLNFESYLERLPYPKVKEVFI